ncbi:hypothetical protein B0H17DRAFT_1204699 [Mycena rosella]|uniref:DUF6532 domain-containing protein n=1 Tax=Mycena rosella TaxID=1033263 RepID=A0AAD7D8M9_MYCRO|nr:hypothetical protein B0H17DRAFT_1204699 [Mycena rosella]
MYPLILSRHGYRTSYLVEAAGELLPAVHVKERLLADPKYAALLADLLIDRINTLRRTIKKVAVNEAVEKQLQDHRYIFPCNPVMGKLSTNAPFRHPAIVAVLKQGVFTGQFHAQHKRLFISTRKSAPKELELPDAMVALAATTVSWFHLSISINFTEGAYEDTYRNHMKTLSDTRASARPALHNVLHGLYKDVTESKTFQPSTGSSSLLINLADIPDSDEFTNVALNQ